MTANKLCTIFCIAIVLILASLAFGCNQGSTVGVTMEIVTPVDHDPFEGVSELTITAYDASEPTDSETLLLQLSDGFDELTADMNGLALWSEMGVTIEGRDIEDRLIASGRKALVRPEELDGSSFGVYFSKAPAITQPPFKLLTDRAALKLCMPNDRDLLIVGGSARDADGTWRETVSGVGYFDAARLVVEELTISETTVSLTTGTIHGLVGHTATPLDALSVLIVGGHSKLTGEEEEISWQETPLLISANDSDVLTVINMDTSFTPRVGHAAANIPGQDRVLICGGVNKDGEPLGDCLAVDSETRTLTHAFNLRTARQAHTLTAVIDDNFETSGVLIYGGSKDNSMVAEWLATDSTASRVLDDAPEETRFFHATAQLSATKLLIAGGMVNGLASTSGVLINTDCLYSDDCDTATLLPDMLATARAYHTLTAISEHIAVACGGQDDSGQAIADCEVFELSDDGKVTRISTLPLFTPRSMHDAKRLPDGLVVIAGGWNSDRGALDSIEILAPDPAWLSE